MNCPAILLDALFALRYLTLRVSRLAVSILPFSHHIMIIYLTKTERLFQQDNAMKIYDFPFIPTLQNECDISIRKKKVQYRNRIYHRIAYNRIS